MLKIQPYGDNALIIQFAKEATVAVSQQVIALYQELKKTGRFLFLTPAFTDLTVGFDKCQISFQEAETLIRSLAEQIKFEADEVDHLIIPVCYAPPHAPDMEMVQQMTGLDAAEIIRIHTSTPFHVYMLGFIAGFPYLGNLPKQLSCQRKDKPRLQVPSGSVGIAGLQTGIYPTLAPGGWQLIGQTPLKLFNPQLATPNFLKPGDQVQFRSISIDEFQLIKIKVETEIYQAEYQNE